MLFVVVLFLAHRGQFIGGGLTLLAALGVFVDNHVGHQHAAIRIRSELRDLKSDFRHMENGLKNEIGQVEDKISVKVNGMNKNLMALREAMMKVLQGDKKVAATILQQLKAREE